MTNTRPSRFFVVPGSRRSVPAPKSTCRHWSGEQLALDPPARDVGDRHEPAEVLRQEPADGLELVPLEEALPDVVLLEHPEPGRPVDALRGQRRASTLA